MAAEDKPRKEQEKKKDVVDEEEEELVLEDGGIESPRRSFEDADDDYEEASDGGDGDDDDRDGVGSPRSFQSRQWPRSYRCVRAQRACLSLPCLIAAAAAAAYGCNHYFLKKIFSIISMMVGFRSCGVRVALCLTSSGDGDGLMVVGLLLLR
jgi:hypothetical protein